MTPGDTDHIRSLAAPRIRREIRQQAYQPPACRNCGQRSGVIVPMVEGPVIRLSDTGHDPDQPDTPARFGDYRVWTCPACGRVVLDSQIQDHPHT